MSSVRHQQRGQTVKASHSIALLASLLALSTPNAEAATPATSASVATTSAATKPRAAPAGSASAATAASENAAPPAHGTPPTDANGNAQVGMPAGHPGSNEAP